MRENPVQQRSRGTKNIDRFVQGTAVRRVMQPFVTLLWLLIIIYNAHQHKEAWKLKLLLL